MRQVKHAMAAICVALVAVGCGTDRTALDEGAVAGAGRAASTGAAGSTTDAGGGAGKGDGGGAGGSRSCPALGCAPKCDRGVKADANGCLTCECNPTTTCTKVECGPAPGVANYQCADGTAAGPTCERDTAGVCGWKIVTCPPTVCPPLACPSGGCPNGNKTDANGCVTCQCNPGPCPAIACNVKCAYGIKSDANGCATCACTPPPTCGPVCAIDCQYGNVQGADGCPTCKCNPPQSGACTPAECGPGPSTPSRICSDGKTIGGPICLRDQNGACGWHITDCTPAPTTCDSKQCPSPAPGAPSYLCPDGKTVAGPACVVESNGSCGWTILSCPPKCVDNVLCVKGFQWDSNVCKCVPVSPPTDTCGCPTSQVCVQQIGGPAVAYPPPPPTCETPNVTCATIDPCACLAPSDGRCKSSGTARTCTCDNGIR